MTVPVRVQLFTRAATALPSTDRLWGRQLAVRSERDEIFALDLKTYGTSGDWDVVVVDCTPTAETLRLRGWLFPMAAAAGSVERIEVS